MANNSNTSDCKARTVFYSNIANRHAHLLILNCSRLKVLFRRNFVSGTGCFFQCKEHTMHSMYTLFRDNLYVCITRSRKKICRVSFITRKRKILILDYVYSFLFKEKVLSIMLKPSGFLYHFSTFIFIIPFSFRYSISCSMHSFLSFIVA